VNFKIEVKMRYTKSLIILSAVAVTAVSNAQLITGFEGATPFLNATFYGGNTGAVSTTIGVTQGTQALALSKSAGFQWTEFDIFSSLADVRSGVSISVDVTTTSAYTGQWGNSLLALSSAAGFVQVSNANQQDWTISTTAATSTKTLTFAIAPLNYNFTNVTNWFRLNVSTNSASAETVYVDNIRVNAVPEPASMAALGMGALALLRRRRTSK
jgi:hypothetical protein